MVHFCPIVIHNFRFIHLRRGAQGVQERVGQPQDGRFGGSGVVSFHDIEIWRRHFQGQVAVVEQKKITPNAHLKPVYT